VQIPNVISILNFEIDKLIVCIFYFNISLENDMKTFGIRKIFIMMPVSFKVTKAMNKLLDLMIDLECKTNFFVPM